MQRRQQPFWEEEPAFSRPRRPVIILPATSVSGGEWGAYGTPTQAGGGGRWGGYRVKNDIAGYNVYIGQDQMPDFSLPPASFSATLPINIATTPPGSGTRTYYIVVRRQNEYGLESQNQYPKTITIDSTGALVLPPLASPTNLAVMPRPGGNIRLRAGYPGYNTDEYRADLWRLWITTTPPDVTSDPPTLQSPADGPALLTSFGSFTPGDYIVTLALYRNADAFTSPAVAATVTIGDGPETPAPVLSGFQI